MAIIETINVGGADFQIVDRTARNMATEEKRHRQDAGAFFWDRQEDNQDNTYIKSYPAGQPFLWKSFNTSTPDASWYPNGMFMQTTRAVSAGTLIRPGVNCQPRTMEDLMSNIRLYVGSDGKLHFTDYRGADSALNFSGGNKSGYTSAVLRSNGDELRFDIYGVRANTTLTLTTTNNRPCNVVLKDGNDNHLKTLYGFTSNAANTYRFTQDYDVVQVRLQRTSLSEADNFWCWWEVQ